MLTLNSLKIQIRILKYSAITFSTSHINSRLLIAYILMLIQNFLRFSIFRLKYSDFNLQYLNVREACERRFEDGIANAVEDAETNLISTPHPHSQPQIQTAYISPVSTH